MKKRISALILAAIMLLTCVPQASALGAVSSDPSPRFETPYGYNDNDYQKLVAFLETEDEHGIKNGKKISPYYDPYTPETWTYFVWQNGRIREITTFGSLVGVLDLSYCEELVRLFCPGGDITSVDLTGCSSLLYIYVMDQKLTSISFPGCTSLTFVECSDNLLTSIDLTGCPALTTIECSGNLMTSIDLTGANSLRRLECNRNPLETVDISLCPELVELCCSSCGLTELDVTYHPWLQTLECEHNELTELDLSGQTQLSRLLCKGNRLTFIDLSDLPVAPADHLVAEGDGTIGIYEDPYGIKHTGWEYYVTLTAVPDENRIFLGWFDSDGNLLWDRRTYYVPTTISGADPRMPELYGRFSSTDTPMGDANADGVLDVTDALLVLRYALGVLTFIPGHEVADVNGDGTVNMTDALLVLRIALGVI